MRYATAQRDGNGTRGFTFLEILIVIAIVSVIAGAVGISFSNLDTAQTLDKTALTVVSVLNAARSEAIASKDASDFGVRIGPSYLVSFAGSYGTDDATTTLPSLVAIATSSGIGTDIVFKNVTGATAASGTITVFLADDRSQAATIAIYPTGVVEQQ